jgi:demethylmenaquinone methyltransferase/2-methoxy-6-polyprenyl-1,4-benzoquinol methylase
LTDVDEAALLDEQQAYYRARAREYDRWWLRDGRFDHGEQANARWFADVVALEAELEHFAPSGDVLELACGTGLWTRHLVKRARRLVAVDAAPEVLEINRGRLASGRVQYIEADLFEWQPPVAAFDVCFFGFWLSHVPESRFEHFWKAVRSALKPGGRAMFVDSARAEHSGARDHAAPVDGDDTMTRRLDDGSEFRIVKRYYEPAQLRRRLADLGWRFDVRRTPEFFIYGSGSPAR